MRDKVEQALHEQVAIVARKLRLLNSGGFYHDPDKFTVTMRVGHNNERKTVVKSHVSLRIHLHTLGEVD